MLEPYAAICVVIVVVSALAGIMLILAHTVGPRRHGPVKDTPYESGVPSVGGARRLINVRFYIVALLFLLFDVEVVFLWPWATIFHDASVSGMTIPLEQGGEVGKGFLVLGMGIFFSLLVFGLVYEWMKGAFQWD